MKQLLFAFMACLFLFACETTKETKTPDEPKEEKPLPDFPDEDSLKGAKMLTLYSTFYYVPNYKSDADGIPLRDIDGNKLGVALTLKKHCNAQLQGSVIVDGQMYGYWKATSAYKVDCSSVSSAIPGTVKFIKEDTQYGTGVHLWPLTPFKSIAVDPNYIPYGSTVYIPSLKGVEYTFEGKKQIHDGIVFAQDTGGVIKGNHIDFFIGPYEGSWQDALVVVKAFKFIKSVPSGTFEAYVL